MANFIQIHGLTIYAPSNLNRDDTGRPKTARFGGAERLRISSQALKRAIRTSDAFKARVGEHRGARTARAGELIKAELLKRQIAEEKATAIAKTISAIVGTPDNGATNGRIQNKELYFMAPEERLALLSMVESIVTDDEMANELAAAAGSVVDDEAPDEAVTSTKKGQKKGLSKKKLAALREKALVRSDSATDIAMFGRMLAAASEFNREAAVQVAHAITTHRVEVEDDFYTAVDDLKKKSEDAGAGFIGELGFGSGVFYLYACIDRDLLESNLGGDTGLASTAIAALIEGMATASPTGKQASFASRSRASYLRIEKGNQQPRQLSAAFFKPIRGEDLLAQSIAALEQTAKQMDTAYGGCFDSEETMNVAAGIGTLEKAIAFAIGGTA